MASQLPTALGVTAPNEDPLAATVDALGNPAAWSVVAAGIALGVLVVTLAGRRLHPLVPGALIGVVASMLVVEATGWDVATVGTIPSGLPPLSFDLPWSATLDLLVPGLVIALVGFAEPASIARRYASAERSSWDPDRELVGQGLANIGTAFTGGYAVGGSFSRSALNHLSGARTRWSGILTGAAVLACLPFVDVLSDLPPERPGRAGHRLGAGPARPAPGAGPGALVATAARGRARDSHRDRGRGRRRCNGALVTGVALALALHLWRELRLDMDLWDEHDLLHVRPQGVLYFGSAPGLEARILGELAAHQRLGRVEIHLQRLGRIDVTGALALRSICRDLATAGVPVVLSGAPEHSRRLLGKVFDGEGVDHTHAARNTVSPAYPRLRERPSRR